MWNAKLIPLIFDAYQYGSDYYTSSPPMKIEQSARHHQTQYSEQQRKLLGIHYTPDSVIDYIVRHTILSYLEKNNFVALPKIKILDPACGSGLFLLKAFDLLCSLWQQQFGKLNANDIRYILENNLYGVDIEPNAIQEAKQQLENKANLFGVKEVKLSIQQGDALLHSFTHQINLLSDNPKHSIGKKSLPTFLLSADLIALSVIHLILGFNMYSLKNAALSTLHSTKLRVDGLI